MVEHVDPDRLTLMALGEAPGPDDDPAVTEHLVWCERCRAEMAALRDTVRLARDAVEHRDAPPAPEPVWRRIADELGIEPEPHPVETPRRRAGHRVAGPRRRWTRPAAALVAAVAVGVAGTLGVLRPWESGPRPNSTAALTPVAGGPAGVTGRAEVVGRELRITASGLPLQSGYYEVWVYDGGSAMVAVGVLGPGSAATLPLPPTLDLRTYHIVDISEEPYDGDQTHSTQSVLRGTLTD